jgi:ABC-type multidrug transport system fused ATPase/permease subunit
MRRIRDVLRKVFPIELYARALPYVRSHKLAMTVVVLLLTADPLLALLHPWPMKILVDNALGDEALPGWLTRTFPFLAPGHRHAIVVFAILGGIVLALIGTALSQVRNYLKARVNDSMTLSFQADMFRHLLGLSFKYHDRTTVGDSLYRLNHDTNWINPLIWGHFRSLFTSTLTLGGMVLIVIHLDWQTVAVALAVAPISWGMVRWSNKHFKDKMKRLWAMQSRCETIVQEALSCMRVVKAFGQEAREQRRFEEQGWATLRPHWRLTVQQSLFWECLSWVTRLSRYLIMLLAAFHVISGQLTVGEMLVILSYVSDIHGPIEEIGGTMAGVQNSLSSAERALEVLDTVPDVRDSPGAKALDRVTGAVSFKDVCFAYDPEQPVLHHVSFSAKPGEVVAIVGPTGAGKTTLANLLIRFYDPASGRVALDGHDLRDLAVQTLRQNIALVLQEPILFSGTILDNIAYGRPCAAVEEVVAAAKAANAHDFIIALPDGYASEVGERGVRLSGGERQRLCVARAFLMDAPVLILDEPTSSIDSRTELVIIEALDRLMVGRTTFIIAHRLSTIRRADQILVLDQGRVRERGTHAELLHRGGLYAELYRIQSDGLRRDMEPDAEEVPT